jgi:hypothetical protein
MITGFNTDVRHRNVVFHVQTEDKGASNPVVESLVYVGGRVLASKRKEYRELLAAAQGEREIQALMERQHRLMIAAIQGGRLDHKLVEAELVDPSEEVARKTGEMLLGTPADGVPLVREIARAEAERTLDQVILEYLAFESEQDHLALDLESNADLRLGSRPMLGIRASSSRNGSPVSGVQVLVRLISTAGQPLVLGAGTTDARGRLDLSVDIPVLTGVCALIVTGASPLGSAEVKQLL